MEIAWICVIVTMCAVAFTGYLYGANRLLRQRLDDRDALINQLRAECADWQSKVLAKTGNTPLGFEAKQAERVANRAEKREAVNSVSPPVVTMRSQLLQRYQTEQDPTRYKTVPDANVIAKAASILDNVE